MKKLTLIIFMFFTVTGCLSPVERAVVYPVVVKAAKWYYFGLTP